MVYRMNDMRCVTYEKWVDENISNSMADSRLFAAQLNAHWHKHDAHQQDL